MGAKRVRKKLKKEHIRQAGAKKKDEAKNKQDKRARQKADRAKPGQQVKKVHAPKKSGRHRRNQRKRKRAQKAAATAAKAAKAAGRYWLRRGRQKAKKRAAA